VQTCHTVDAGSGQRRGGCDTSLGAGRAETEDFTMALVRNSLILSAALLIGAGCTDSSEHDGTTEGVAPVVIDNDVEFIDAMVPHHEMAVMMADMELAKGSDARVKEMAQTMKDAQTTEIAELKATRKRLTGSDEVPEMHDPHMDEDMDAMMGAQGAALDRMFLEHMVPHHAGAIQMAHNALPNLKEANLKEMADMIVDSQSEEIGMIHDMLMEL
jgi:uncharacterized protein (DUF305 family)